jgi:hypothetical protein
VKTSPSQRRLPSLSLHSLHYAWIVAAVTFVTLLLTAAIRATPSILIVPFENEFRWTPASMIATVPPTVALTAQIFGRHRVGLVFGWIFAAHQLGAAAAASFAATVPLCSWVCL